MVPLGRMMGLRWMASGVERVRVMRSVEEGEMVMAVASEVAEGAEVCWVGTRMVS